MARIIAIEFGLDQLGWAVLGLAGLGLTGQGFHFC
jgi:hypothetical protein